MASRGGREFERELSRSVATLLDWPYGKIPDDSFQGRHRPSATATRPCDFVAPIEGGRTLWLEAKQTRQTGRFDLGNMRPHQAGVLETVCRWGHLGWLAINMRNADEQCNEAYAVTGDALAEFIAAETRRSLPLSWLKERGVCLPRYQFKDLTWGWDVRRLVDGEQ